MNVFTNKNKNLGRPWSRNIGIRQAEKKEWVKKEGVKIEYHVGIVYILLFKHFVE